MTRPCDAGPQAITVNPPRIGDICPVNSRTVESLTPEQNEGRSRSRWSVFFPAVFDHRDEAMRSSPWPFATAPLRSTRREVIPRCSVDDTLSRLTDADVRRS